MKIYLLFLVAVAFGIYYWLPLLVEGLVGGLL